MRNKVNNDNMIEVCGNCCLTKGSHRWKDNQCPTHEGREDWPKENVTAFASTGVYRAIVPGTPARLY